AMYSLNLLCDFTSEEADYKKRIEEILSTIENEKDKSFLNDKLANSQRATFKMKFIQFLNSFKTMFLEKDEDIDAFSKIIKNTRNYYTHLILHPKKIIAEKYLPQINRLLENMIVYHLLWWYNDKKDTKGQFSLLDQALLDVKRTIKDDINNLCKD
ncbi:MAG: hypothetical protein J6V36_01120, partial [Clostridia bacterium]|nr:hypothetical protein [Clostridia bacterium]